jgi:DNA mismatch repair ATPase MutS
MDEADSQAQNLFILDEVFKGTNTVERISSAKAILSYLNQGNNLVIASTHDIELSDLLKDEYDLYHFTETIEDDQLHFDHKIKVGRLTTRNAIKILELSNYPASVIDEARKLSSGFKKVIK